MVNRDKMTCVCCSWYLLLCQTELVMPQVLEEEKVTEAEEKATLRDELETLKKEQDDLLVLLADQDAKIAKLKDKLKELGQEVSTIN